MAEQENFEEDLFADLYVTFASGFDFWLEDIAIATVLRHRADSVFLSYDDNDASKGAAPAPAAANAPAPVSEAKPDTVDTSGPNNDGAVGSVEPMNQDQEEDDDDDDDVDFNLGGGSTSLGNTVAPREEAATPPPYGTVHKASAKEDG